MKEPARTPLIEPSSAGSGRSRAERHGIPIGWAIDGANRNDVRMLEPTLDAIADAGLLVDIDTLHLDRGYDSGAVRERLRRAGIDQFEIQRRGTKMPGVKKQPVRLGLRWIVEATNTWWSNYGQLRRNTDRRDRHRHAALCLATVDPHRRQTKAASLGLDPGSLDEALDRIDTAVTRLRADDADPKPILRTCSRQQS